LFDRRPAASGRRHKPPTSTVIRQPITMHRSKPFGGCF
jgi:hypothetical protein